MQIDSLFVEDIYMLIDMVANCKFIIYIMD